MSRVVLTCPMHSYPSDNCAVVWPNPNNPPKDPLELFPQYLTHNAGLRLVSPYLNSTMLAQQWGKPFIMFETNSASCGGFPGISDTFTSALWGLDYALQMANSNFTQALFHFGGQNVSYNVRRPLSPPAYLTVDNHFLSSRSPPHRQTSRRSTNGRQGPSSTRPSSSPRRSASRARRASRICYRTARTTRHPLTQSTRTTSWRAWHSSTS